MAPITKATAAHFLKDVNPPQSFWCHDGQIFVSLHQLEAGLSKMTAETYAYHANTKKNDFSNWVKDVVNDVSLADSLKKCKTKESAHKSLKTRITSLKKVA